MLEFLSRLRNKDGPSIHKEDGRRIDISTIGSPVLRSIPRRFEVYADNYTPYNRSNGSHRSDADSIPSGGGSISNTPPPARHAPNRNKAVAYPLIRSYSLPLPLPLSRNVSGGILPSAPAACRANSISPAHCRGLRRQLSPILEQGGLSPVALQPATRLPESEISTLNLPRLLECPPVFVQRELNKSQTSGTSTAGAASSCSPTIPMPSFTPYFPGPHPSWDEDGPARRPLKALSELYSCNATTSSSGSLHAESFVTANSVHFAAEDHPAPEPPENIDIPCDTFKRGSIPASVSSHAQALERHGTFGSGSLKIKRQRLSFVTPAFCLFFLGFLFPPFWWIGGWYLTFFSEKPPQMTFWEYYVTETQWWATLTCGCGKRRGKKSAKPTKPLLLPRWVGRNDPTPSLKGISYYYPFVSRPPVGEKGHVTDAPPPIVLRPLHRFFDEVTNSQLAQVKEARESPRRMIDPWIERCRRALCYWCLFIFLFILAMIGWSIAVGTGKTRY